MCLHVAAFVITFYVICNMTRDEASTKKKYLSKYRVLTVLKVLE